MCFPLKLTASVSDLKRLVSPEIFLYLLSLSPCFFACFPQLCWSGKILNVNTQKLHLGIRCTLISLLYDSFFFFAFTQPVRNLKRLFITACNNKPVFADHTEPCRGTCPVCHMSVMPSFLRIWEQFVDWLACFPALFALPYLLWDHKSAHRVPKGPGYGVCAWVFQIT